MESITISIPEKIKKQMEKFPEINWPIYIREKFILKLKQLRKFEELVNAGRI